MLHIGLLSDTHGYFDPHLKELFKNCDEVWHSGDWGEGVAEQLEAFKPVKGVYGNIDGKHIRAQYPELNVFMVEEVKVMIIHIAGYPGKYSPGIKELIMEYKPNLLICGHSHILKVMKDNKNNLLFMNPGAAGKSGFHIMRTALRFDIEGKEIKNLEVIEMGKRNAI